MGGILILFLIMFGPAALFFAIGGHQSRKGRKKAAKIWYILGGVYLLISLGTCGWLLASFSL